MISQNILNLVDTAMVGTLGNDALAAVGLASFVNFLMAAFILGISSGVQAVAARRAGENRHDKTAVPLNEGLALVFFISVPWTGILVSSAPQWFSMLNDDTAVVREGTSYLQIRLVAIMAMGMNFSFRAYWNAINRSMIYLQTLTVMHLCNVVLNWVLIFGHLGAPKLGVQGAALASAISTYIGTAYYFFLAWRLASHRGFLQSRPTRQGLIDILRLSVPAGIQQSFFAGGMVAFFWIVGKVGTIELAATQVIMQLLLVGILPGIGFGIATATLVGQALGRNDPKDAYRWPFDVIGIAFVVVGALVLPALLFPHAILSVFTQDEQTLAIAATPLRMISAFLLLDTVGLVLMHALMGAGDMRRTMLVSVFLQWFIFLPAAYVVGPVLSWGLMAIWIAHIIYRGSQSGIFLWMWKQGAWAKIRI